MTRRRVIFPPADYWTNPPQENTVNKLTAGDYRRAAVLTLHQRQSNQAGVTAIVDEVNQLGNGSRSGHLLMAILNLHAYYIGRLRTPDAIKLLQVWVGGLATYSGPDDPHRDVARAAQILEHHGNNDYTAADTVLHASVQDGRATTVLFALMNLYEVALPELDSDNGIAWLHDQIGHLAGDEASTNDDDTA